MMSELDDTVEILSRTPAVLHGLLTGIGAEWHGVNEGQDTWSAFDVVSHLIHAEETNWMLRARMILEKGESAAFQPFDRFGHLQKYSGRPLDELLNRFGEIRASNLQAVQEWRLTPEQLTRRGRHPDLGPVTLQQLFATWAVHDLGHIGQVVRVMAKRYKDDVGPWRTYLSILN